MVEHLSTSEEVVRKLAAQLKLRHLRILLALEETLSITAAAQKLNVSAAAVSKSLGEMEGVLGLSLLERGTRVTGLTEAGQVLVVHGRAILAHVERAAESMATLSRGLSGTLRLASTTVSAQPAVSAAMLRFQRSYPRVVIQFAMEVDVDVAVAQLLGRDIDLLFSYADQRLEVQDLAMEELLGAQSLHVVSCHSHPLARPGARPTMKQLWEATWCLPAPTSRLHHHLASFFRDAGFEMPQTGYVSSDLSMIVSLMNGAGCLALVPDEVKKQLVAQGLARRLAVYTSRRAERVLVALHAGVQPRPATQAFKAELLGGQSAPARH